MSPEELAGRIQWTTENHDAGDPLCVCSWCRERIEASDEGLECVSCGCPPQRCAPGAECCDQCDHTEPIIPIRLWREDGRETAQFHVRCFDELLELGVLTPRGAMA